jgi:hypothetical protein
LNNVPADLPYILPDPANATGSYAASPLSIPTYDGGNQPVHPDVVDFGSGNTWNGYRYWMVFTPFTNGDSSLENPSIVASADGDTFVVPAGLTNPIALPDETNFADPDLIYDNNTLYCIWMNNNQQVHTGKILESHSTDGITWSAKAVIYETTDRLKGPAAIKVGSTFYIYFSDNQAPQTIYRISSTSMTSGWGSLTTCTYTPSLQTSHIEAVYNAADKLYYLYDDNGQNFGLSNDGINFVFSSGSLLTGTRYSWSQIMYRGSLVRTASGFDFWYSARDASSNWGIGRTTVTWSVP